MCCLLYFKIVCIIVCDQADTVGRITLVRVRFGEIMLGWVSSDEVGFYF